MGKLITVEGRTLKQSDKQPPPPANLTYTLTEKDITAARTRANSKPVLISQIKIDYTCAGAYAPALGQTFAGSGSAVIEANSPRLRCEGQQVLLEGDKVTISCDGTITTTSSGATSSGKASVTVTIETANQTSISYA